MDVSTSLNAAREQERRGASAPECLGWSRWIASWHPLKSTKRRLVQFCFYHPSVVLPRLFLLSLLCGSREDRIDCWRCRRTEGRRALKQRARTRAGTARGSSAEVSTLRDL